MTDHQQTSVQAEVQAQFDRQVGHYLQGSAMADQGLLELIFCSWLSYRHPRRALP